MHQNCFRLGLCPRPHWGSSQRSPRPSSWIKGGLLLREGDMGKDRKRRKGRGRQGRGGQREGMEGTPIFYCTSSSSFLEICLIACNGSCSNHRAVLDVILSVAVLVLQRCWLGDRKGIRPLKTWAFC